MHTISRNSPCYYLTSVAKDRLGIFRTDTIKLITCAALDEARRSGKFALYAYVIMPDHLHTVTDSSLSPARTLQFINGIISRRVIGYLKEAEYASSLSKLRRETGPRGYSHSLWDHHPDARLLLSEKMLMQRVQYTHQNPVRAGLVEQTTSYRWSSVRCWTGNILDDEPLLMDTERINWMSGGRASQLS
jgi:REP element-mobilizing transposase RayT